RTMPEYWQFPTVSMGLGPLAAVYQARCNRYLHHRGIKDTTSSRVWAFLGDGECDEPESLGALHVAAREGLDNLTFVVNCNLQRLDGPVRGNGKIIPELEAGCRGSGWNVIKVMWAREWDDLLARDVDGVLVNRMGETTDGESQRMTIADGAYIREHFFGPDPRLRNLVEHLSDEQLRSLRRGGHDYRKVYAAYHAAVRHTGATTEILPHAPSSRPVTTPPPTILPTTTRAWRARRSATCSNAGARSAAPYPSGSFERSRSHFQKIRRSRSSRRDRAARRPRRPWPSRAF